jgi:Ca2+-binding EF-hand superfamily protein
MRGMKYLSRPLLALAAWLLAAAAQVQAQSPAAPASAPATPAPSSQPGQSSHVSEEQAMEWFNLLDTNHDGCISRQEARAVILIAPKLAKDFNDADTNHDGCITPDEIRALVNRRRAEREARRAAEARQKAAAQPSASEFAPAP